MANYRFTTRLENRDDDGIGLLFRVADDGSFYRINWATEGSGTGTTRPPAGMSIQKYKHGIWTQVFSETMPKFLPADSVPFDVIVSAVDSTFKVDVLNDPDGTATTISYGVFVDHTDPILTGSVGFTNWANGEGGDGAIYSAFLGDSDGLVTAISTYTVIDLHVSRTTSKVTLTNNSGGPVTIDGLSIRSGNGNLNPAQWSSISANYDEPPGNGTIDPDDPWTVVSLTDNELTEREQSVGGNGATLSVGETVDLGNIWRKSQVEDISLIVELFDGSVIFGNVHYAGDLLSLTGDYNADDAVDVADYVVWRKLLGTNTQLPNEGSGVTQGMVTPEDYTVWRANFGNMLDSSSSAVEGSSPIPEPAGFFLVLLAALGFLLRRGGGRSVYRARWRSSWRRTGRSSLAPFSRVRALAVEPPCCMDSPAF